MKNQIVPMQRKDWAQVHAIYAQGLATGIAAFMTTPPMWDAWDAGHLSVGRIVAKQDGGPVLGWAALGPVADT